jgi:hypothetical protein
MLGLFFGAYFVSFTAILGVTKARSDEKVAAKRSRSTHPDFSDILLTRNL